MLSALVALGLAISCAGSACNDAECRSGEGDAQSLLSTPRHAAAMSQESAQHGRQALMRADDLIESEIPETVRPEPFKAHLRIDDPLPAPNPAENPLINGYAGDCRTVEKWPWFTDVPGKWFGSQGQNFISVPQVTGTGPAFLVIVNNYTETWTFEHVTGVLNRGYLNGVQVAPANQSDQVFSGVSYHESVTDVDLKSGIHEETGFILHQSCRPANAHLLDPWQVLRMGSIPHGSMPMGFGSLTPVETPDSDYYVQMLLRLKVTHEFSVQPFVPGCGSQLAQQTYTSDGGDFAGTGCCLGGPGYMIGANRCPASGCPEPIDQLIHAVKDLNVVKYIQLNLTTENTIDPNIPSGGWFPGIRGGGVQNTAYVNINANAETRSFKNMIWLVTVRKEDGSTYDLIQYIQTVNLKFLRTQAGCPDILWPHVDANTLHRVS